MKKNTLWMRFVTLFLLAAAAVFLSFVWRSPPNAQETQSNSGYNASTYRAQVRVYRGRD